MTNKQFSLGILMAVLTFGLALLGCPVEPAGDRWSKATSLAQLDGRWVASYSDTESIEQFLGDDLVDEMADFFNGMKVTTEMDITLNIDARAKKQESTAHATFTFFGRNIHMQWGLIKLVFGSNADAVNEKNHSITLIFEDGDVITAEEEKDLLKMTRINQHGTKLLMPADALTGVPEIIYIKQ